MQEFINYLNGFQIYIMLGLAIIIIILLILIMILFSSLNKLERKYRKLMRGVNNKNLEELVENYMDKVDEAKKNTEYMKELYNSMEEKIKGCIQRVSVIRYRAFEDVGSDLSFSIALLDNSNSGVVLTGIYGRNESTTYAKPIDKGISRYELSDEEAHVLKDAMGKN